MKDIRSFFNYNPINNINLIIIRGYNKDLIKSILINLRDISNNY